VGSLLAFTKHPPYIIKVWNTPKSNLCSNCYCWGNSARVNQSLLDPNSSDKSGVFLLKLRPVCWKARRVIKNVLKQTDKKAEYYLPWTKPEKSSGARTCKSTISILAAILATSSSYLAFVHVTTSATHFSQSTATESWWFINSIKIEILVPLIEWKLAVQTCKPLFN